MSAGPTAAPKRSAQQVFICYRREETAPHAGRLYDAMVGHFGEDNVFMDVDMAPGVDFVERITEVVSGCLALIVVIGPSWASARDEDGNRRLEDPADFVRLEVETGLGRSDVTPIPVLVAGARMPKAEELPAQLRPITRRNAVEMSETRWGYDVTRLFGALEELLTDGIGLQRPVPTGDVPVDPAPPPAPSWRLALEGMALAGLLAPASYLLAQLIPAEPEAQENPTTHETVAHIVGYVLRESLTLGLTGAVLAVWLSYRLAANGRFRPWLRGLVVGAIAGAVGGAIWALPVLSPDENLNQPERRKIELGAIAVTGGLLGGLLGSLWRPPRVGAALLAGALGAAVFQLLVIAASWDNSSLGLAMLSYGLAAAAIAGLALAVMVGLDRGHSPARGD
jgi:hypothetical protein